MAQLCPYLIFDNNCREAMTFYRDCLGGVLTLQTVGESPAMAAMMPAHMKDRILHSTLVSGGITIMASDLQRVPRVVGTANYLCINCDSEAELRTYFSALATNGQITEPLAAMPWGGLYGALTDQYGHQWVFNCQLA